MTEKQKDFWGRTGGCYLCQRSEMASEDASFLWRLEQREMHIWGTVFPAEGREGPWDPMYLACAKKQERGQAGRVRHQVGGTGVTDASGAQTTQEHREHFGLVWSVMEGQRKLLCRVWPWPGWQFRELQLENFPRVDSTKREPIKGHSHGSPWADFIIFRLLFFWPHHRVAYRSWFPDQERTHAPAVHEPMLQQPEHQGPVHFQF